MTGWLHFIYFFPMSTNNKVMCIDKTLLTKHSAVDVILCKMNDSINIFYVQ